LRSRDVSLAICSLNRRADLLETVGRLREQRCDASWELLVVDNGSEDGTWEAAREFASTSPFPMRVIREPRRGVAHARNLALEQGAGEILVFVDDDVDCDPGLLKSHLRAFLDSSVNATGGRIQPRLPENTVDWLRKSIHEEVGGPTTRYDFGDRVAEITVRGRIALPISCNLGLRRALALRVGGFRPDLGFTAEGKRIGGEDTELMIRMSRLPGKILYLPDAKVVHRVQADRVTEAYYKVWNIAYGRASVRMHGRYGPVLGLLKILEQLFRILRYSVLPWSLFRDSRAKRCRKRYQALGRILELLGIDGEP